MRQSFFSVSRPELAQLLVASGMEQYRATQIFQRVYQGSFQESFLPRRVSAWLHEHFDLHPVVDVVREETSLDSTAKLLLALKGACAQSVESVLIPDGARTTLCLSSQVGCSLSCKFCHTGTQKLEKNLSSAEIVSQYLVAGARRPVSNLVFMGQGEPLYNWRNVARAVQILTDPAGPGLNRSKVVISTSGIAPAIPKIAQELGVQLAVSLHATNDTLRTELMPINATYPIAELIASCRQFVQLSRAANRRITFEYVMLDGVNDDVRTDAGALVTLLKDLPAHVNLIPFNPWNGSAYQSSPEARILAFSAFLNRNGLASTIRWPRGKDISAACGQLHSKRANAE